MMKMDITEEWIQKRASLEDGLEINFGRVPEYITGFVTSAADRHYRKIIDALMSEIVRLSKENEALKNAF